MQAGVCMVFAWCLRAQVMVMVEAVAGLLATLHANGRVHRDIKV